MKKLVLIFVVLFSFLSLWGLIQSAPSGGDWGEETSWIGYIVPGPNDDVLITSNIVLNVDDVSCHNLTISSSGLIQNDSWHRLLTINGDLSNAGIIRNCSGDPGGYYHLYISVYGNMENSGNIINYQIFFSGSEDQYLTNTDTGSLSPVYITDENSASSLILLSNVNTNNSKIDMNMSHLELNSISGTFNLSMSGGYLTDAIIIGGNGASLSMTGGCYLENISADEIVFNETVIIMDNVIINILINQGIVYSFTNSERTLTINQKLENYGTIRNNDSYYTLCINIGGDLYNYGSVVNKTINLTNAIEHLLYIDDESHSINCTNFTVSGEGSIKAISNLYFLNCNINLNNRTMILYDDNNRFGLYLNGGSLSNSVLDGGTGSVLKLENNAYLSNVSMDDFIWQGTVMVQDNVSIDNLINQATVYGVSNNTRTLTINQRLDNYGTIRNNPGNYWLYINIGGDLYNYNYGNIVNNKIDLTGTVQHKLYQSDSSPSFNCTNFVVSGEGSTKALSNIYFLNCEINLNGKTMILYDEDNSYGLYINGGKLLNASLDGGTESVLKMENNAYLSSVSMDDFIWQGTVMVQDNVSIDNLINQATVYGVSNYARTLIINQKLENYETIRNNPSYWLYLNIAGDVYNYGTIVNNKIDLTGTVQHKLYQSDSSHSFNCTNFIVSGGGSTKALSNLYYTNCVINLNNSIMQLYNGSNSYGLYINGGKLLNANLDGGTGSVLKLENNAYLDYVSMDDCIWQGTVMVQDNVSIDNLINQATVYGVSNYDRTLTINQRLDNYGTIRNNSGYWLYLNIGGDLYNYSSIINRQITMNGTQDQHFQHMTGSSINVNYFTLASDVGAAYWYFNDSTTPVNSSPANSININPTQYGTWQPRNPETGENGRHIIISTGEAHIDTPTAFTIYTDNGIPKLRWNQVSNALFYHLFVSTTPEGLSTVTPITIYDTDLSDNIVTVDLQGVEPIQFYRVTAGY